MASINGSGLTVGRVSLISSGVDCVIIVVLGMTILLTYLWGEPYHRGFFCDDDSIRFPLKGDTVVPALLIAMSVGVPAAVVLASEAAASAREGPAGRARRVALGRTTLPVYWARVFWTLGTFIFGLGAQQLLVDAGKYTIGRLRPHFLDACQPSPPLAVLCGAGNASSYPDALFAHTYVTAFRCTGPPSVTTQARLSFPSGHSSMSFYAAIFTVLYLERRFRWRRRARMQVSFAQLTLVLMAWLTALSRVTDYKHHWSDALFGSALGALVAALTVVLLLWRRSNPALDGRVGDVTYVFDSQPSDSVAISIPGPDHAPHPAAKRTGAAA